MKKAINKQERHEILLAVVVASAVPAAQKIIDSLTQLRLQVHGVLLNNWEDQYPGISKADQLSLLQSRGANSLSFRPSIYALGEPNLDGTESKKCIGEFGKVAWQNSGTDAEKQRLATLASRLMQNCTGAAGIVSESVTSGWNSSVQINHSYADIIQGHQPGYLYEAGLGVPDDLDAVANEAFVFLNEKIAGLLHELKDLFFSCETAYQALSSAIAPVKTAARLAELMPEAVKHFPASLMYVKPTKQLADPKAINEIRAKLKKGLPI